jgi:hypothetical protein
VAENKSVVGFQYLVEATIADVHIKAEMSWTGKIKLFINGNEIGKSDKRFKFL